MQEEHEVYEICAIGTIVVDSIFEVPQFPRDGETMEASNFSVAVGGGGAAQAVAAARLLGKAILAGQIGDDEAGKIAEKELEKAGVNIKYLRRIKEAQTGVGYITLTSTGHNSIIASLGANLYYKNPVIPIEFQKAIDRGELDLLTLNFSHFSQGKYVLLQRGIPNEVNILVAKYAHSAKKIVCLDTGGRSDPFSKDLLQNLDFITPNEIEVEQLIGQGYSENIHEVIRAELLDKYPNLKVLLRLGANGCAVVTRNIYFKLPVISFANPQILKDFKIIDVTGGGDSWIAAFFCKYSQIVGKFSDEVLYRKSMLYANTCAFLCLTRKGCVPSMPHAKSVNDFIQKYLKHLDI